MPKNRKNRKKAQQSRLASTIESQESNQSNIPSDPTQLINGRDHQAVEGGITLQQEFEDLKNTGQFSDRIKETSKIKGNIFPDNPRGDDERQMAPQLSSSGKMDICGDKEVIGITNGVGKLSTNTSFNLKSKFTAAVTMSHKPNFDVKINPTFHQKFLPKRPDSGGKKGREIPLIINCLNMKIKPTRIFMYDIELIKAESIGYDQKIRDVTRKMKRKEINIEVVREFLKDKSGMPVFNGGRIIFSNKLLPYPVEPTEITFKYDKENTTCYFTIQRVKEEDIELNNLNNYVVSGKGRSDNMPQEELRAIDAVLKEMFLNGNFISIGGRGIFDKNTFRTLKCGPYILIEGYAITVRPHMLQVRFNFDKTQVVCHEPINLLDYIEKIAPLNRFDSRMLIEKLKNLRVKTIHSKTPEGNSYSRIYTIFGFSAKSARDEKIVERNLTIEEYFENDYNIKLKYPNLPMIKTNTIRDIFVPIELLEVLPFQKVFFHNKKIEQEVIRSCNVPCFTRLDKLKNAITNLGVTSRDNEYLKNYNIEIESNLINVRGRVLAGPDALFGYQKSETLRSGKWNIRNKQFVKPYDKIVNWALFAVGQKQEYDKSDKCLYDVEEKLVSAATAVGIKMEPMYYFNYLPYQDIESVVGEIIKDSKNEKKTLDLLVFVIQTDEDYRAVKTFGDMSYGVVTQCMNFSNLLRQTALDQYLGNVMLKINTKLGGINWEMNAIKNDIFSSVKQPFMVFGIDVTHPSSNRKDLSKSIAAMVGSIDHSATQYNATIRQQISTKNKTTVEIVLEMEDMVYQLIKNYCERNSNVKPKHLIFYRDGVSEGQFEIVFEHEIASIKSACEKIQNNYQPPITYIVVQKRHKIRFFPSKRDDGVGISGNVPSGTIIDTDITHCREFDFYLCSHDGIQGTSKPAHYHVLFDENQWGSDDLQSFTYCLCHAYARSTRSVSYPAPTYYAHLAAFRGRTLIGQPDDDNISIASGYSGKSDVIDSEILINEFHNEKLFFI